ncbi:hypothetical protein P8936_08875 [Edaphobacter paludis]|uniref:Glycosyltransferase RgtA/B/C/D-like domain-containing protein n=1 Tax=Edaphobacter paludis TaxID=3035702 RepID=A0AAU7D263_9BACT
MATTSTFPIPSPFSPKVIRKPELRFASILVTLLTAAVLLIHGYHPYAEDGGLYMAGIKRLLDPALYPHDPGFVTGHLRFSLFAPMVAALVRQSHLGLPVVLLLLHLASVWLVLFAAYLLAARCYDSVEARMGAVSLVATWITLPIAGTSLMLMDPYVTARSLSTPCVLFALVGMIDFLSSATQLRNRLRGLALCGASLVCAAAMHPLMAAYGFGCVLVLGCVLSPIRRVRLWGTIVLCLTAFGVASAIQALSPPADTIYRQVATTRFYWFLAAWHWYELLGLAAPLIILSIVGFRVCPETVAARRALARMSVICGVVAVAVALLFARPESATLAVARLQPLRIFQIVYIVMILAVGAALAEWLLQRHLWRWAIIFSVLSGIMFTAERRTFANSAHLELPWKTSQNQWEQAFLWIKQNTPKTAFFALDAHYITAPGEDAQCFRAIAERSALPDYSKDGGEASITPQLTSAWQTGEIVQARINTESDAQRTAALKPLGVTWVVLKREAITEFPCAYTNAEVKVCRLP